MARVPLQTSPQQELAAGSEVQFGATSVEPQRDVVSDDIQRQGKALQQFGQVINKLDDELNDAESKQLSNEYYYEAQAIKDRYGALQGANAVGTTKTTDGKFVRTYDTYRDEMKTLLESYQNRASNGTVKYIFENKAQVYTKSFLNDMTTHSLKQQRLYNEDETEAGYKRSILAAKNAYKTFEDPEGDFRKYFTDALQGITEFAQLKGWETDPAKGLSDQYLQKIEETKMEIAKDVVDKFKADKNRPAIDKFLDELDKDKTNKILNKLRKDSKQAENEDDGDTKVDAILSSNVDQNNGNLIENANILFSLSSNQSSDDGKNAHVKYGFHSDELDISNLKRSEAIDLLDKRLKLSKFYDPTTTTRLIPQHQAIHMFAAQRIGVKSADSLYTRAEREYKASIPVPTIKRGGRNTTGGKNRIDKYRNEFFNNPDNFKIVNEGIVDKYIELVKKEFRRKNLSFYSKTKNTFPNAPQRNQFPNTRQGSADFSKALKEHKANPDNAVPVDVNKPITMSTLGPFVGTKEYEGLQNQMIYNDKVSNDFEVIKKNINYDFDPMGEETIVVDEVTGLQPKKVLAEKIKETTKDPVQQKYELDNLDIKYEKIKNEKEGIYNQNFIAAKEIAFAEPGGWQNLAANNINIDDYTEADKKILKEGPPEESDVDTVVELIDNPAELRDNIDVHSHKLSRNQFAELKRYSETLKNENNYVEATGNVNMLKATLDRYDMGNLHRNKSKKNNIKYIAINDAWLKEINARQIANGNVKLTMGQKQDALNYVLLTDLVSVDRRFGGDRKDVIPATVEFDNLQNVFVDVLYEGQNVKVFTSKINSEVLSLIQQSIRDKNKYPTQALIAEYWLKAGKPENETQARENLKNYGLSN
mgnify:CR=1 FL=1